MSRASFLAFAGLLPFCLAPAPAPAAAAAGFPLEQTDVQVQVSGPVAELTIRQVFRNTHSRAVEATYVFPLHEDAAVDAAAMRIGEREIQARIHTREEAREIYEEARDNGQAAALTEQERPNVFTQSVANIPPGATIEVLLHVIQPLEYESGRYTLTLPLVVGPRFVPEGVEDAAAITPPVALGYAGPAVNIDLDVELGLPLADAWSPSHPDAAVSVGPTSASGYLDGVPADRDFVLQIDPATDEPAASFLAQDGHFTLLVEPQPDPRPAEIVPRELIFLVDRSCSMSGQPLATVHEVMDQALAELRPTDSFQILDFSDTVSGLAPEPLPATPANIARGRAYMHAMTGDGGTNMLDGIEAAMEYVRDDDRQRVICLMTDGYIGNEQEILASIEDGIGGASMFAFGIGEAVNRYLLDGAAEIGRGGVTYVLAGDDRAEKVAEFYQRIESPVLTDIQVDWGGMRVTDVYPRRLPDLYAGQPLVVTGRYTGTPGQITLRGRRGGGRYEEAVRVQPVEGEGIAATWARARVHHLERQQMWGEDDEIKADIVQTALKYRILTRYTSFVAVERRVVNPGGDPLRIDQALALPAGVTFEDTVTALSRDAMRPGDPLLTVEAPEGAQSVIALFPWGERATLRWDDARGRWFHRFLVPREIAEGDVEIVVLIRHADGRLERQVRPLRIDATAPEFAAEAWIEDGQTVVRVSVEEPLRALHVFPVGRPDQRVRVDLRGWTDEHAVVRLPGEHAVVEIAVKDEALNLHRQEVEVIQ